MYCIGVVHSRLKTRAMRARVRRAARGEAAAMFCILPSTLAVAFSHPPQSQGGVVVLFLDSLFFSEVFFAARGAPELCHKRTLSVLEYFFIY